MGATYATIQTLNLEFRIAFSPVRDLINAEKMIELEKEYLSRIRRITSKRLFYNKTIDVDTSKLHYSTRAKIQNLWDKLVFHSRNYNYASWRQAERKCSEISLKYWLKEKELILALVEQEKKFVKSFRDSSSYRLTSLMNVFFNFGITHQLNSPLLKTQPSEALDIELHKNKKQVEKVYKSLEKYKNFITIVNK